MDLSKLSLDELEHEYQAVLTYVENNEGHNHVSSQDLERIGAELLRRLRDVIDVANIQNEVLRVHYENQNRYLKGLK